MRLAVRREKLDYDAKVPEPGPHQDAVDRLFDAEAQQWADYYRDSSVDGTIYRSRQDAALKWVDDLQLEAGARALDAGCGAGELTAALSHRGFSVEAIDSAPAMVAQVERRSLTGVHAAVGNAEALDFPDESFDVVTALGLLPWVPSPVTAMRELARVMRPGGHGVFTVDNRNRLTYVLDPRMTPVVQPIKQAIRRARGSRTIHTTVGPGVLEQYLAEAGLEKVAARTVGFGPFTFFAAPVFPRHLGISVHERLQALADGGSRMLSARGTHYMVLARRPVGS